MQPAPPALPVPPEWDVRRDLVVLVGRGHEVEASAWIAGGQERLIVLLPEAAEPFALSAPGVVVNARVDLLQAILNFQGDPPQHVTLRTSDDDWVTPSRVQELGERIQECVHSKRLNLHTICVNGPETLDRSLANVVHVARHPSIAALDNAFERKPCVIVSPGPSLSKNLHLLEQLKGHALLVTGTHALASFRTAGVAPDIVLAADPGDLDPHYDGHDLSEVGAMAVSVSARGNNFERGARHTFSFSGSPGSDDWIFEPLGEDARLPTGGSVACSAFSLAVRMGCAPILFVGQDLAFEGGRYYAKENLDGDARVELEEDGRFFLRKPEATAKDARVQHHDADDPKRFTQSRDTVELPGYYGGTVPSSESFRAFLFWFEANIEALNGLREVWNCTEGGARISGAEPKPLATAIEELASAPADRRLVPGEFDSALDRITHGFDVSARAEVLDRFLVSLAEQLQTCRALAARAKAALPKATRNQGALAKFEALEAELSKAIKPLRPINLVAQREIIDALEEGRRTTTLEANLAAAGKLIRIVERAAVRVQRPLEGALQSGD